MTEPRPRLSPAARAALVVATVIILGAIGFVVWFVNTPRDPNQEATQRLQQWQQVFERYREKNGALPELPAGGYCLGRGFPTGSGGTANCRDYAASSYYTEADSTPLMEALASVATLPTGVSAAVQGTIGPYAEYRDGKVFLLTAEEGGCVAPATEVWNDGTTLFVCGITLTR
ncbi:hypothetical protein [Microbacterium testaceum]|uniref:hypothetical protein n=1 Tax=Microbacterium testaceum TaxID=2033 RepID=UPI001D17391D|nr:hypothetical protein [Microbacterium testaceum]MCC4249937.1 hypothetical protein [Microbacterium testaceum]